MAVATVESSFVLIDRATGPVRKIRRELRGMERDAVKAGKAMDEVSGPRQARQLEVQAREMRVAARETRQMDKAVDGLGRSSRRSEAPLRRVRREVTGLGQESKKSRLELAKLAKVVSVLKWPVLIAGAGGALQALGGLAGGAVALVPKLMDVGGAAASAGALLAGVGLAMGTVKLATNGLDKALAGNANALKALTPEGRAFVQVLRQMQPEMTRMRRTAQRGLFPGLTELLGSVRSSAPQIRSIVRQTAGDLSGLASFGAKQIRQPTFMRDLVKLSDQGGRALGAAARSAFYFAHAAEQVVIAAGPLTDWLGNSIEAWAKNADEMAMNARQTGKLERYFDKTKKTLQQFGDIGGHVFSALGGLMRAARGQSDDIYSSIDKGAARWDEWSNSFKGQNKMRRWFDDVRPGLDATVHLVGDLGKVIGRLSSGPEGAAMIQSLDKALPSLEKGVSGLTSSLGPAAIGALANGAELLGELAGTAGPLTLVATAIGTTAKVVTDLLRALGPLGPQVAQLAATGLILKRVGLIGGGGGGGGGGGMLAALGLGAAVGGRRRGAGSAIGAGELAIAGGGGAAVGRLAALRAGTGTFGSVTRNLYGTERALGAGRVAGGIGAVRGAGALTGATAVGGKVLWPLAAASGLLGALGTQGDFGAKAQGGASALSLGIIPKPISAAQRAGKAGSLAGKVIDALPQGYGPKTQARAIGTLRTSIRTLPGNDALGEGDAKVATAMLKAELKRRVAILKESEEAARDVLRAQSVEHANALVTDFAGAFKIRARTGGPQAAMDEMTKGVLGKLRSMNPAGREVLAESTLAWAREAAQQNPKLRDEYNRLASGVERRFSRMGRHIQVVNGDVLTGSRAEWKSIQEALTSQTDIARQEVSKNFTAIQQSAVGSLTAMGMTPAQARSYVRNQEATAKGTNTPASAFHAGDPGAGSTGGNPNKPKRARGGRIQGHGLMDTVPMVDGGLAAPGELIVNRHTESDVDRDLRRFGRPTLGQRVAAETRSHSSSFIERSGGGPYATGGAVGTGGAMTGPFGSGEGFIPVTALAREMGLQPTSGRSNHNTNTVNGNVSDHSWGGAVDYSNGSQPTKEMDAWTAFWGNAGLAGAANGPSPIKQMLYRTMIGGNHFNHVHMALERDYAMSSSRMAQVIADKRNGKSLDFSGASAGGSTAMFGALSAPGSKLGGLPGAVSNAASSLYASALTAHITAKLGTDGGGAGAGFSGGGTTGSNQALGKRMMLAHGWGNEQWGPLKSLWTKESGWNEHAKNPSSGAYGIPQSLPASKMASAGPDWMDNPATQIKWGLGYIKDRYGSPSGAWAHSQATNWYEKGGRLGQPMAWGGWHKDGIDAVVDRPTLFGAGEAGRERVTVTPSGKGGGAGATVHLNPVIHVQASDRASLRAEFTKLAHEWADMVHDEIHTGSEINDAGVMG